MFQAVPFRAPTPTVLRASLRSCHSLGGNNYKHGQDIFFFEILDAFLKITSFVGYLLAKKTLSYEELIALPRSLSWQGHGNQPKPRPLPQICLKKSHIRGPYQSLQAPTIGPPPRFKCWVSTVVPKNRPIRKATKINPPTTEKKTLKVSPNFPPSVLMEPKVRQFCSSGSSLVLRLNSVTKGVKGFPELAPWIQEAPRSVGKPKSV